MKSKAILWLECLGLFVMLPILIAVWNIHEPFPFFPVLLGMTLLMVLLGRKDPEVTFNPNPDSRALAPLLWDLLPRILISAVALTGLTAILYPDLLFRFPRENPRMWMLVMLLYPLLSVVPQELIFRSVFVPRYARLFGHGRLMLWINAAAFAWAHLFFLNPIAPLLSGVGGLLLTRTWQQTRDLRLVCIEHALYGQMVFTCGIGWFFYQGSTRALETLTP